jgi:Kdo2-lipid IVA lauroyltransferase/acyltransferase
MSERTDAVETDRDAADDPAAPPPRTTGLPEPGPDDRRPTFQHRLEYALFAGGVALARLLGARAESLGAAVGRLGYRPLRIRRDVAERHLRHAFPDASDDWVRATARAAYAHLGRETIALLRMADLSRAELLARSTLEGRAALLDAIARGNGVAVVAGHLGNWEIGAAILAANGVPIDVVAQRQNNPLFDRAIVAARRRLGVGVIERGRATRQALRSLRAGRAVAFAADQNAGRTGVFVPFFGRLASTHRGAALMALRTGAPIFLAVPLRAADGRYHMRVDEVDVDRAGDPEEAVARMTAAFTARLQQAVQAAPAQYLWLHRRWKTRPPEERNDG